MKTKRNSVLLVLAALLWGISFVSQSKGGDAVGPYSFNSIRSFVGSLVLVPAMLVLDKFNLTKGKPKSKNDKKNLIIGGISCGIVLTLATNLQQLGITFGTPAGKAGFLTACYIVMVPILGIFLKKKCGINVWISVGITVGGLYLLCMNGSIKFQTSDILVLACAVIFAVHILTVDHFSPLVDGVRLSCLQFLTCGIISAVPMIIKEIIPIGFINWVAPLATLDAWIPILYAGVLSCGVAYTLQIVAQNGVDPTIASLLLSLESVFSVIAGWIILGQAMSLRALSGCALIFGAVVLAQINFKKKTNTVQL